MLRSRVWILAAVVSITLATPGQAEERLHYAGATTLQRYFMPEAARIFGEETGTRFIIEGGNTGPGIAALLKGEVDLAGSGRYLTEAEQAQGLVEHFLGWDVLTVLVNQANTVEDLSLEQLQAIFAGDIKNWQEVGGPDQPILVITSPRGAGMRTAVKNLILKDKNYLEREVVSAIVAESDQQVRMLENSITGLSKSMVDQPGVRILRINGIEPTAENLSSDRYPLAKPLALITRGEPEGVLGRFIDFALGPRGQNILKKNFVPRYP